MANPVQIDIPGIGLIEAKNAASQKTLEDILKILEKFDKKVLGGGGSGGAGSGAGGAGGGAATQANKAGVKSQSALNQAMGKLGVAAGNVYRKMMPLAGGFIALGEGLTDTISKFANMRDSLESAANVFSSIPLLGGMFSAVASAAESSVAAFQQAAASGASFSGSVNNFARSASEAGMTLSEFGSLIRSNGAGMLGLGGTVEEGAKRFSQVSKTIRSTGGDLYALGMSTQDINQGLANYSALLRQQGMQGNRTNAQLAQGAKKYLKEMDALAKITGEERSAKEAQAKQLASDAQFQASMAGLQDDVRESFQATVLGLPEGLRNFSKDIMATGTATTEENQKLLAMMPQSAAMLQEFHAKQQRGEAITLEERNRLNNLMKQEGGAALQTIKQAGAASGELGPLVNSLASTYQINTDAVKQATAEQKAAAAATDKLNQTVTKGKEMVAAFSNSFTMALANSGMLDTLLNSFQFVANFVQKFFIPAFNLVSIVLTGFVNFVLAIVKPAFDAISYVIGNIVYPALINFAAFFITYLLPPIQQLGQLITENVAPVFQYLGDLVDQYVMPVFSSIAGFIQENMVPIFMGLSAAVALLAGKYLIQAAIMAASNVPMMIRAAAEGILAIKTSILAGAMALLASPVFLLVAGVTAVVGIFTALYRSGFTFESALEALKDNLTRFGLTLLDFIDSIREKLPNWMGGISEEESKKRKELRDQARAELDEKEKLRDIEREAKRKERGIAEKDQQMAKTAANLDMKMLGIKTDQIKTAEKEQNLNLKDPHALLKGLAQKEKSAFVTDPKYTGVTNKTKTTATTKSPPAPSQAATTTATTKSLAATSQADAARQSIENEAQAKKAEEEKRAKERQNQESKEKEGTPAEESPGKSVTQETLLTELKTLNMNMEKMVAQQYKSNSLLDNSLSVQKNLTGSLSGDLFAYPAA